MLCPVCLLLIALAVCGAAAQNCDGGLLCSDPSVPNCRNKGEYKAWDCTCNGCPRESDTTSWKYNCLTNVLKVCPSAEPPDPCQSLCSDPRALCSDPGRLPDSACVCVPCQSAGAEQLNCAKQRGFCFSTPTSLEVPSQTPPLTERPTWPARKRSNGTDSVHSQPNAAVMTATVLAAVILLSIVACGILWFKCAKFQRAIRKITRCLRLCPRSSPEGANKCDKCNLPVRRSGSDAESDELCGCGAMSRSIVCQAVIDSHQPLMGERTRQPGSTEDAV